MLKEFENFVLENYLFAHTDKLLVAVSGGADSVALVDILSKNNYNFAIAHFNFRLRGADSEMDEIFVKNLAKKYNVQFFVERTDTLQYAKDRKISVEMAARKLRYDWFNSIIATNNLNFIVTAHHSDDNVETILLNLAKKSGLRGLCGIPVKNNNVVRPLLFASKKLIMDYCNQNNLTYRTDHTNFETIYERNKIRHLVIPQFKQVSNAFEQNVIETAKILKKYQQLVDNMLFKFINYCTAQNSNSIEIDIQKSMEYEPIELFYYEFLKNFGFNSDNVNNLLSSLNKPGNIFYSKTHKIFVERNKIIVTPIIIADKQIIVVNKYELLNNIVLNTNKLTSEIVSFEDIKIDKNSNIAYFDIDKLQFPIIFRHWQNGDYFYPFGLGRKKKISNFFVDKKIGSYQKINTWLMLSGNKIAWIVGHRTDERFKIDEKTKQVLVLKIQ